MLNKTPSECERVDTRSTTARGNFRQRFILLTIVDYLLRSTRLFDYQGIAGLGIEANSEAGNNQCEKGVINPKK
jgi:hypothetical protein